MLEQLRRQSGSFIIWFLFAIIIAAFVLFFGPQASGDLGCGANNEFIVEVDGVALDIHDWRFAMNSQRSGTPLAERQTRALDALVARTLLANASRDAGFDVSEDHVVENLKRGIIYILGLRIAKESIFEGGVFDYDALKGLARSRGLPGVDYFLDQQREEILAAMMRTLLVQTPISREEANAVYVQQNTTVTAKYVKYDVAAYLTSMTIDEADVARYLAANEKQVKAIYDARKRIYDDVKPEVRVRHIMFTFQADDPASKVAANARAKDALARLGKGEDFAAVAREMSDHKSTKNRGGDLGWRRVDSIGFGKEVSEAAKKLKKGQNSEAIETKSAVHIIRIEGERSGKLSFDDVKLELAEDKARSYFAREAAKRDAEAALARVKEGTEFDALYPKPEPADEGKTGAIVWESEVIPASWGPIAQAGGGPVPKLARPGAAPPADAEPPTPVELPSYESPPLEVQTLGPTPRRGEVLAGLGRAPELSEALFQTMQIGSVTDKPYEVAGGFAIAKLEARDSADLSKFDGVQVEIGDDFEPCSFPLQLVAATHNSDSLPAQCLSLKKGIDNLQAFLYDQCSKAAQENRIRVNSEFLRTESGDFHYTPCGTLNFETALIQVMSLSSGL